MGFLLHYTNDIPLPKDVRTDDVILKYNEWTHYIIDNDFEINDYLYNKYLLDKEYSIDINPFPYNVDTNIFHYVLWVNHLTFKNLTSEKRHSIILKKMKELGFQDYICFENHSDCKSVDKVIHYQIFFRKCQ